MMLQQRTLKSLTRAVGVGVHGGQRVEMTLRPAPPDSGIVFRRVDLPQPVDIQVSVHAVTDTRLATTLSAGGDPGAPKVHTVEHLMSACAGLGIDNLVIDITNEEVPILDGSAAPWVQAILSAGLRTQDAPLAVIEILEPVEVRDGLAWARLEPSAVPEMDFTIDFPDAAIGHQEKALGLSNGAFVRELCDSRTFCRQSDVDAMRTKGLALGGTYLNAVVVDGPRVLTPGGLRHSDEAVRHKMLDALGDLATAGAPILGRYVGHRAGHTLTNKLLHALFERPEAWRRVRCDEAMFARLPGAGLSAEDLAVLPAVA